MLVASVHDPDVFCLEQRDKLYCAYVLEHARKMAFCHVPIICEALRSGLDSAIKALPSDVRGFMEEALKRKVELEPEAAAIECVRKDTVLLGQQSACVALRNVDAIDAVVTTKSVEDVVLRAYPEDDKVRTFENYSGTPAWRKEKDAFGFKPIGRMDNEDVLARFVTPFVRWATKLVLIDPYVSKTFAGARRDPRDKKNKGHWGQFARTIKAVYGSWHQARNELQLPQDVLEIRTVCVDDEDPKDLAKGIWQGIGAESGVEVVVLDYRSIRNINHDRFLVSNNNTVLTVSRGFDLFREEGVSAACTVSLGNTKTEERDTINKLLISSEIARYPVRNIASLADAWPK